MAKELAFVLINPYSLAKSRTGGIIARYIARTQLDFVAARMFHPSRQLSHEYAALVGAADGKNKKARDLLADYVLRSYSPDIKSDRPRRVMLLLFEGENAIQRIADVTGDVTPNTGTGQTIRDTFGDYVLNDNDETQYFEPAVLVADSRQEASDTLQLWAKFSKMDGGFVSTATDVPRGENVHRTLVLLKPDNFQFRSLRPGNIIDVLSRSGLRIVATNKFKMTVAQAEAFYGPVREVLTDLFSKIGGQRLVKALKNEFGFETPEAVLDKICPELAPLFAAGQFENIVEFMTGYKPAECSQEEKAGRAREECLALVYEGPDAVNTIREILGATDPSKADPGSIRKEFGSDVMVNAAHASDSPENAIREMGIVNVDDDGISEWVEMYYGKMLSRMKAKLSHRAGATE
jgi:nucleoside diphosphate kinase